MTVKNIATFWFELKTKGETSVGDQKNEYVYVQLIKLLSLSLSLSGKNKTFFSQLHEYV